MTKTLESYCAPAAEATRQFGDLLVHKGLITPADLAQALREQREKGGRLGEVLLGLRLIDDQALGRTLAEHLSIEYLTLDDATRIDTQIARTLPESIAKRFCLIVLQEDQGKLLTAMADPLDVVAIDTVMLKMQRPIRPMISAASDIRRAIETLYHGSDVEERQLRDLLAGEDTADEAHEAVTIEEHPQAETESEEAANQAPVIRFVDLLLRQAVKNRASDIHIEPQADATAVRLRVDGLLREVVPPPKKMHAAVAARIKILAQMNIAERRLPQDGRLRIRASGREIDVRVSTIPTIYGEKVAMRVLDSGAVTPDLNRLGIEPTALLELKSMLARPHGIIIVTGPTGSGKSTTCYAALNYLKSATSNITTVEDPVEYRLAGINQIQVKPEIGLDFARCLRAILRQDPDIVLIGESRDKETVEIAIKAAMTGHLVLTTFHTNDAPSTISRLTHMGIERYLLSSTLNLIVAQRLVRRICDTCKEPVALTNEILRRLRIDRERAAGTVFYRGRGCHACDKTGYHGRLPIFEFLIVDEDIAERITAGQNDAEIRRAVRNKGRGDLLDSGVRAVLQGQTTAEEVIRVASMTDE
ncbi:MAG: Flp pilus assembly complex ATPase component TadA [Planctomycetes bacterium]|jgi:type II secretory ATPase GspE/PulE/Tfp pilus assembly ATPase PilB-like protein|nr:Flp pilus assembly complex ATPase component TadA [Planctomycetota bacterium]